MVQRASISAFMVFTAVTLSGLALNSCASMASPLSCAELTPLRADEGGADRAGSLWIWDQGRSTITWIDPAGELVDAIEIPESRALAADREWGVVSLDPAGTALRLLRPGQIEPSREIQLPNPAGSVAWLQRNRVALAPTRADALVEIWDLAEGRKVRALGEGHEIQPAPGATFLRALMLAADPSEERLYALDSVTGTLRSFSFNGEERWQKSLKAHRRAELERWLEEVDRQARQQGAIQTPIYWVLDLQVGAEGAAYVVERCSEERDRVTWVEVGADGSLERVERELDPPVCSLDFVRWRGRWLFLGKSDGDVSRVRICKTTNEGGSP